jgi:hypothetical protein
MCFVYRKGEVPPGKRPTYDMPVFHRHGSVASTMDGSAVAVCEGANEGGQASSSGDECELLSGIYDRNFIDAAQRRFTDDDGVPRLTRRQVDALDALDATCDDPGVRLDMRLEPGDVQWLHNHTTFHARCAYCGSRRRTRGRCRRGSRSGSGICAWGRGGAGSGSKGRRHSAPSNQELDGSMYLAIDRQIDVVGTSLDSGLWTLDVDT